MSRILSKSDLCSSCLKIRQRLNDGSMSPTIEEFLGCEGYRQPETRDFINEMLLFRLEEFGGCSSCINMLKRANGILTEVEAAEKKAREAKEAAERAVKEKEAREAAEKRAREEKEAFERLCVAAEQGNAESQLKLGNCYFTGDWVTRDYAKAAEWFGKAAAQGDVEGKDFLAKVEAAIEEEKARKEREAKEKAEREAREAKEKAERAAEEMRRKTGRIASLLLEVFFIIMAFVNNNLSSEDPSNNIGTVIFIIVFFTIPFLVLYFSYGERKILRGIFLGIGVLMSVLLCLFFSMGSSEESKGSIISFIAMNISYMASCITAMIFPKG